MSSFSALPAQVTFAGSAPFATMTRHLDTRRIAIVLADDDWVPANGTEATFELGLGNGVTARGRARVESTSHVQIATGRELLVQLAVTAIDASSLDHLKRAVLRERMAHGAPRGTAGSATPDAGGILGAPEARAATVPQPPSPVLRSERAAHEGKRLRPRPGRHHWENEDRFRVR